MIESDRISLLEQIAALRPDRVFVASSGEHALDDAVPDAVVAGVEPVAARCPPITIGNHGYFAGIRSPNGKSDSTFHQVSTPVTIQRSRVRRLIERGGTYA